MKILADSYEEAKRLLSENRELMEELANFLLEKESITGKEFMKIFHKYIPEEEEEDKGQIVDLAADKEQAADMAENKSQAADMAADAVSKEDKDTDTDPGESGEPPVTEDKPASPETKEPSGPAPNFTLIDTPSDDTGP